MAEPATASTRLPRGTKPVANAFLAALDALPELSRSAVAKAAQAMIRDELKDRREKQRASALKAKPVAVASPIKGKAAAPRKPVARRRRSAAAAA